jgi:hypothetical protein
MGEAVTMLGTLILLGRNLFIVQMRYEFSR